MKQALTLNERQLRFVLSHCSTRRHAARDRAIVMVNFLAGLRAKEIAALTLDNVRSENGSLREEFILNPEQTKGGKARRVFVNTKLRKELEQCGLDGASSHSGRRTFITNLAAKGVSVRILAELASHSNISTTQRYIDVNDNHMRAAVELV